jgi:flagellar hook-associated protein 1
LFTPSSGALKGDASVQNDINDYMDQLNKLAKSIAFSVNAVHSGQTDANNDALLFFVNKDVDPSDLVALKNGEANITAGNISVNKLIMNDVMLIKTRTHDWNYATEAANTEDGETDGARALAIAQLRDSLIRVQDMGTTITSRAVLFSSAAGNTFTDANKMILSSNTNGMKIDNYFRDTVDKLGIQSQEAQRMVKNQETLLASFEESRASVSGVSLDEEMTSLIQFQHAYQANAKIISTVDQLLDVVINGLKR